MVNIKSNRALSFIVIILVYLFSTGVGISAYYLIPEGIFEAEVDPYFIHAIRLLIADVIATVFVFVFSLIFGNASVYDPYWSVQPIVIVWAAVIFNLTVGGGVSLLGWLTAFTVSIWGVRLTANWAYTFHGLEHQDWRYTMLHERTGRLYPVINFLGIHLVPTLVVYFCVLPADFIIRHGGELNVASVIFLTLSLGATAMQAVADVQMQEFRNSRVGGFIRTGLWKNSRHPNYLGEILMWWGIGLSSAFASGEWILVIGAVLNSLLFIFVSIPMAERRQSRKDGFEQYKRDTRVLLPIPKPHRF